MQIKQTRLLQQLWAPACFPAKRTNRNRTTKQKEKSYISGGRRVRFRHSNTPRVEQNK